MQSISDYPARESNIFVSREITAEKELPMKKFLSLALSLVMICVMSVSAFAAEIDTSGGSGSTHVSLSSTSDGTEGDTPSATAMRVTVTTALPMAMSQDGVVTTADNCKIVNNSYGAVRVKSVTITAAGNWSLTAFGNKSSIAGEKSMPTSWALPSPSAAVSRKPPTLPTPIPRTSLQLP